MFSTDFGLGTLISNLSNRFGSGKRLRERMTQERRANYGDDLAARSEAWKAQGLHPLVGLQIPMEGPMVGGGGGAPAPRFNWSPDAKVDPDTARYKRAQADLAELQVEAAQRKLAGQPGNAPVTAATDQSVIKPAQITSVSKAIPYQTAGPAGATETQVTFQNILGEPQVANLPSSDISEPLEGMGEFWKAIIGTPMGGRAIWHGLVPDSWKIGIYDFLDRLRGARDPMKQDYRSDPAYRQWLKSGRR